AIQLVHRHFAGKLPVLGFAGAPFTLASYMIEGGTSRSFLHTKSLLYRQPAVWEALMAKLARVLEPYLLAQVEAGAAAIQLFDSWVGCLGVDDYRRYVLPHSRHLIEAVQRRGVPVIHFATGSAGLLRPMQEAGADVLGIDWRIPLGHAWEEVNFGPAIQGNLDPAALFAPVKELRARVRAVLEQAGGRPGHIFNLGHGILPDTPVENVRAVVDWVHEYSARQRAPDAPDE
ncbi:MAG: uroporphyrinogen decarboxylase family protein, partial [Terriglobia bacterium]